MNKTIVCVNPWIYDFAAYDFWIKPVGLLMLAGFLKNIGAKIAGSGKIAKDVGKRTRTGEKTAKSTGSGLTLHLIDCLDRLHPSVCTSSSKVLARENYATGKFYAEEIAKPAVLADVPRKYRRYGIPLDAFVAEVKKIDNPDCFFVTSMMTYWYPGVFKAIEIIRDVHPGIPVVLGGIYATLCYEHAKANSDADVVIKGPAEDALSPVLSDVLDIEVGVDEFAGSFAPLTYDLYDNLISAAVLTTRGCPYRCTYCASKTLYDGFVKNDGKNVVDEIEYLVKKRSVGDIAFYDDALLYDSRNHVIPLLKELIKRNIRARFHTPNGLHPRFLSKELAQLMRRAGFTTIRLSFEGSDPKTLARSSRKVTASDLARAADNLTQAGFERSNICAYLLCGLPGQRVEDIVTSMLAVHKTGVKIKLAQFSAIPHTQEYDEANGAKKFQDPLTHNNTALTAWDVPHVFSAMERIKRLAALLNEAASKHINLAGDIGFAKKVEGFVEGE